MPAVATQEPKQLIASALGGLTAIAALPETTATIIATVENPKSTAAQLHRIVSNDPALVTRVLKVVNSAFYGLPGQIGSIERAIVLLGLNAVKNIAVAASLGQMFRGLKLCEGYSAKDLWTHCVSVAIVSRDLARRNKLPLADEAFLAGMVHDIGLLVALQSWPEKVRAVCDRARTESRSFIEIEEDVVGVDHQLLGQAVAEKWHFPRPCQMVAAYHHNPSAAPADARQVVAIVRIADVLCCVNNSGFSLTAAGQTIDDETLCDAKVAQSSIDELNAAWQSTIDTGRAFSD